MDIVQARTFLAREFPQNTCEIIDLADHCATVRQRIGFEHLRPGNTVSGPAMMMIADCAAYVAILGACGETALAVTTSLNINFLRRPMADCDIVARCEIIKAGKRLVVCEIGIYQEGHEDMVAHATATYSIPPDAPGRRMR